jgi:hypothetical protein
MNRELDILSIKYGFNSYEHLKACVRLGINSFDLYSEIVDEYIKNLDQKIKQQFN